MNKFKTIFKYFCLIIIFVLLISVLSTQAATIYTTNSTDTIGTFRTNVNSSLTNLNNALGVSFVGINFATSTAFTFATSTAGTDFIIATSTNTITFQLPSASATVRGLLTSADWTTFNNKLSTAIISLGGLTGSTQTFATSTGLNIISSGTSHTFSLRNLLQLWSGLATSTGNLYIGDNTSGWTTLASSTAGKILMASSTAQGMSWETIGGGGITSLNSQTGATQTFATSTNSASIAITSTGNVHTLKIGKNLDIFNALATTTNAIIYGSNASGWLSSAATGTQATVLSLGSNAYNSTAFITSATATSSKSLTIESPTATDNITIFTPKYPITINRVSCINNPVSGNSTTFNLMHHTARATTATTTAVFASNKVCTSTSTPTYWVAADFQDATMAVDEILWLTTSAASSTAINISIDFTYD